MVRRSEVDVHLPFTGLWRVENSPAQRVPSHGSELFGERYAIDFVGVDARGRSATTRDWRSVFSTEPPERFVGFGRPILAPVAGTIAAVHDGEPDHEARRSQLSLVSYALGQGSRIRQGLGAIAGNHVVISADRHTHVALVHLESGSLRVAVGDRVTVGQHVGDCGNSGNSTQPHVHMQVMDVADPLQASGVPLRFRHYREWLRGEDVFTDHTTGVPNEGSIIQPSGGWDVSDRRKT